jgi:predicted component of type VI protein secretion system
MGRHPECDIQLNSRKISRRHCIVATVNNYLVVRDLGSTNGIRINGVRVLEGRLNQGDELTVGSFQYRVNLDGADVSPLPAAKPVKAPPVRDADLEDADEPVPLADDSGSRRAPPAKPVAPPANAFGLQPSDSHVQ